MMQSNLYLVEAVVWIFIFSWGSSMQYSFVMLGGGSSQLNGKINNRYTICILTASLFFTSHPVFNKLHEILNIFNKIELCIY